MFQSPQEEHLRFLRVEFPSQFSESNPFKSNHILGRCPGNNGKTDRELGTCQAKLTPHENL